MKQSEIKDRFQKQYGLMLENYLTDNNFEQDEVERFFNRQKKLLIAYCKSIICTFNFDKLPITNKDFFNELVLEQMYYVLCTFDYTTISGIDIGVNTTMPLQELTQRYISPIVKMELNGSGLLFRGLW